MGLNAHQHYCLRRMGIDVWVPKPDRNVQADPTHQSVTAVPEKKTLSKTGVGHRSEHDQSRSSWQTLRAEVQACRLCPLHRSRTQTVFGTGNPGAEWLLIGEAPGKEEDRQGEPFVGRAGKLLDAMLHAMGLTREGVFIANILKCRPPANRDPESEETTACTPYLQRQIRLIRPRIILALGRVAAQHLLQVQTPISHLRGRLHHYQAETGDIPLVVTWHPAYLLRRPMEKVRAWEDLQAAMQYLHDYNMQT